MKEKELIVGIDPGMTTAYAALDFEGSIIEIFSKKNFSLAEILKMLNNLGNTIIIATDVMIVPKLVLETASKMNAIIVKPSEETSPRKKRKIAKEFLQNKTEAKIETRNKHELAALFAAITAYKKFSPLLNKLGNVKVNKAKIITEIIAGKAHDIKEAVKIAGS